ncbi:MAG: ATP-binding protein [Sphingobium sp.]
MTAAPLPTRAKRSANLTGLVSLVSPDAAGHRNMVQLVQLRWLAVAGQLATILIVHFGMGVELPLLPMLGVLIALVVLNVISLAVLRKRRGMANAELFVALLLDVAALTVQLYLSGGATNPFVSLFLLQVVLGSVLLDRWSSWVIVIATSLCFAFLMFAYQPLRVPQAYTEDLFGLHVQGMWACFALMAVLLVLFVTRISGNLRARDNYLADMRQQAAEQDHIVRIGLLATGAAHELGTPLSSLSVALNDWQRMPQIASQPEMAQEVLEMQAEVQRCKAIVTGILLSAGAERGEASVATTMHGFFDTLVAEWRATRPYADLHYDSRFGEDMPIVSVTTLKQVIYNLLDNAAEASTGIITLIVERQDQALRFVVRDTGTGFPAEILANIGKPYYSTKGRPGAGLGLFLVVNVMRKLGGDVTARNRAQGGAEVTATLPLSALALTETPHG